jgi:hypothetical protein
MIEDFGNAEIPTKSDGLYGKTKSEVDQLTVGQGPSAADHLNVVGGTISP